MLKVIKNKIRKIITMIRILVFGIMIRILSLVLKLKDNRVLFLSDVRNVLDGNLKFVYDMIDDERCEKICIFKKDRKEKRKIKEKFRVLFYLATSKYIILDDFSRLVSIMKVRKGQEICQLWHGAGAFKKFGYSRQDKKKKWTDKFNGHRNYTKACVTADSIKWCYAEGFGIGTEKVKATGMPRTDVFFNKEYVRKKKEELYKTYPYLRGKKIILFAPTYRGTSLKESYYDFEQLEIDKIYEEFADKDYIFIFKWHPGLYYQMKAKGIMPYNQEKYTNFCYDFSELRDINELLLITDILITDYSSVIFDYALLDKPVIYFTYDYEEYQQDRGLYFNFDDYMYGRIAKNTNELIDSIKEENLMEEEREIFIDKFMDACDGNATKKTCEWIFEENLDYIKLRSNNEENSKEILSVITKK